MISLVHPHVCIFPDIPASILKAKYPMWHGRPVRGGQWRSCPSSFACSDGSVGGFYQDADFRYEGAVFGGFLK